MSILQTYSNKTVYPTGEWSDIPLIIYPELDLYFLLDELLTYCIQSFNEFIFL